MNKGQNPTSNAGQSTELRFIDGTESHGSYAVVARRGSEIPAKVSRWRTGRRQSGQFMLALAMPRQPLRGLKHALRRWQKRRSLWFRTYPIAFSLPRLSECTAVSSAPTSKLRAPTDAVLEGEIDLSPENSSRYK